MEELTNNATSSIWQESLPEDIRNSESLGKFKDVSSLATSYLEAEKALSSRIAVPDDSADEDIWGKFYQKLGRPEDKRYTDKRLEGDEQQYLADYEEMFFNSGLSRKQGASLIDSMYDYSSKMQEKQELANKAEMDKIRNSNMDWLRDNYGKEFDTKMTLMQAALKKFGSRELAQMLEDSLYSPALVDMLAKAGLVVASDKLVTGNEKAPISDKEQALKEIKKLENDSDFVVKLSSKNHAGHTEAVRRMHELHNIAYG